ncbi:uncharacterized protein LOC143205689 isoform X2 [Rhynchophorus ferrugineus]|uniref:uncharacterized protein LOC143205689 isoform X2 n=1 Tax=Rhynchophorus ferrugineus TaxID=354439 RepID=UPI003FCD15DA
MWPQERGFKREDNSGSHPFDWSLYRSHGICPIWKYLHIHKHAELECHEIRRNSRRRCSCGTQESGRFTKTCRRFETFG